MNRSGKTFVIAVALSVLIHFLLIFHFKNLCLTYVFHPDKKPEILFDLIDESPSPPHKKYFVDTPEQPPVKEHVKSENISDKNSRVDSSQKGEESGVQPASKEKDLLSQAMRYAPSNPASSLTQQMEQFHKAEKQIEREEEKEKAKMITDNTTLLEKGQIQEKRKTKEPVPRDPEEQLNQLQNMNVSLIKSGGHSDKSDIFPLPLISLGERTMSVNGLDAFDAEESEVGKYFKVMRDKIGLRFYQMVFFHYRTSYIFGSKVDLKFNIKPNGTIENLETKLISGDPIFEKYCETVLINAAPFAPLHEKLKPYLEGGVLKMDILFGYDVKDSKENT
jgi:hypothetical protein